MAGPRFGGSRASGVKWVSEKWTTRRGRIYLIPGDSPIGFRLPLDLACLDPAGRVPVHQPA
nr:transglutaminase family protein [Marinicella sp. W31]MDC2876354.1 transglutaminase family protein [Marinicella sp. W31]